jgi:short chain dehydrogenase
VSRERQDAGHTARSCFVWPRHLQAPRRLPKALFLAVLWAHFRVEKWKRASLRCKNKRTLCSMICSGDGSPKDRARALLGGKMKTSIRTHEGHVALVTGAGQGIGQAIALALAERGARVVATDLEPPRETARKIGPEAFALQLDVTREEDWRSVSIKTREIGDVDIVVNNAGYFPNRAIDHLDLATWRKTMATNLDSLLERQAFLASDEEEEVGPVCRHFVKHGWLGNTGDEPLHRHKDGNHRVHERFGK